jgi:hypothetical protein
MERKVPLSGCPRARVCPDQEPQVQLARALVGRCRSLTRTIVELDHELTITGGVRSTATSSAARECRPPPELKR